MAELLFVKASNTQATLDYSYPKPATPTKRRYFTGKRQQKLNEVDTAILVDFFETNQYPGYTERMALAETVGISETRIQIWFQNRRTRLRRKKVVINKPDNLPGPSPTLVTKKASSAAVVFKQPQLYTSPDKPVSLHMEQEQCSPTLGYYSSLNLHHVDSSSPTFAYISPNIHPVGSSSSKKRKLDIDDYAQEMQPLDLSIHASKKQRFDIDSILEPSEFSNKTVTTSPISFNMDSILDSSIVYNSAIMNNSFAWFPPVAFMRPIHMDNQVLHLPMPFMTPCKLVDGNL